MMSIQRHDSFIGILGAVIKRFVWLARPRGAGRSKQIARPRHTVRIQQAENLQDWISDM